MTHPDQDHARAAILMVDPYNDFISEGGKLWDRVKGVAEGNNCVPHMLELLSAARQAKLRVFYALHHRYRPGDYESWEQLAPIQRTTWSGKFFEAGTWGGAIRSEFAPLPGEITAQEHWCSSGFANTDLDLLLRQHGIRQIIVVGLLANTCVEATVRSAVDLGYRVTAVKDAIAALSDRHMDAALLNISNYASALMPTTEAIATIAALSERQ
jgi:ureidoacrylate peracid hydrolase